MKKVIIIGATSGIGKELAKCYSLHNYEVGITGRRSNLLTELAAELPSTCYHRTMDVTDTDQAMAILQDLIAEMQSVDIIVISAGTGHLNDELDWSKEQETIATNVCGFCAMVNVAMKHFIKQGFGHLVGLSSLAALRGSYAAPAYNASKAFESNYLEGLHVKAAKLQKPIYVTTIEPGFVDTAMAKGDGLFWVAPPAKAAAQVFNAVAKKKRHAYVTRRWQLFGWLLKIMPNWLYKKL